MNGRRGIIGSSGGSALQAALQCLRAAGRAVDLLVLTDRECGLGRWARAEGFETRQYAYRDAGAFSTDVHEALRAGGCSDALLFYTRRVSDPLVTGCSVSNIHPSLLPAFPGLHGVDDALAAGVRLLGATLHRVDRDLDTGPISAQVACALPPQCVPGLAHRLSYLQKVWLTLLWLEGPVEGAPDPLAPGVVASSATLADRGLLRAFARWQAVAVAAPLIPAEER